MSSITFDSESYRNELAHAGLEVVEIASTPSKESGRSESIIIDPTVDPVSNPSLAQALKVYSKHYLASENGILGEGEAITDILSRLQGNDEHVTRMSILGLKDKNTGEIVGVSFIETYPIDKVNVGGVEQDGGLAHLCTYAAVNPPHENTRTNAAFHAAMLNKLVDIDKDFGCEGKSVLAAEVNCFRGFDGQPLSNKMAPEFEIKTGAPREMREAYVRGNGDHIIPLQGTHNNATILGLDYTPPNLGEGEDRITLDQNPTAGDIAPLLRNQHIENGEGEPLFLVGESPYHPGIKPHDAALLKAFAKKLNVSVAMGNHGIENQALILDALGHPANKGYSDMMKGLDDLAAHVTPPTHVHPEHTQATDIGRNPREIQK